MALLLSAAGSLEVEEIYTHKLFFFAILVANKNGFWHQKKRVLLMDS